MGLIATILAGIAVYLLGNEFEAWLPRVREVLLKIAVRCVPLRHRERFAEEWAAHLNEMPGELAKTLVAADFIRAGCSLSVRASHLPENIAWRLVNLIPAVVAFAFMAPWFVGVALLNAREGYMLSGVARIGKGGRKFFLLRFRTYSLADPTRTTRVGEFLRRTKMEHLPLIVNVLKGDIDFVGPRPRSQRQLNALGPNAAAYLAAKPGIVGAGALVPYDKQDAADVEYLKNRTLLIDLRILARVALWEIFRPFK